MKQQLHHAKQCMDNLMVVYDNTVNSVKAMVNETQKGMQQPNWPTIAVLTMPCHKWEEDGGRWLLSFEIGVASAADESTDGLDEFSLDFCRYLP